MTEVSLTDFLFARIAEDEVVARAATTRGGSTVYTDARRGGKQAVLDHVMRHDPARVLAECEAKRRIVELHENVGGCAVCTDADYVGLVGDWPCDTLRALAVVYADHPDYREEWRP